MFYSFHYLWTYVKGYQHVNIALECFKSSNFTFAWETKMLARPLFIKSFSFHNQKRKIFDKILLKEPKVQNCISVSRKALRWSGFHLRGIEFQCFHSSSTSRVRKLFISNSIHRNNHLPNEEMNEDQSLRINHPSITSLEWSLFENFSCWTRELNNSRTMYWATLKG